MSDTTFIVIALSSIILISWTYTIILLSGIEKSIDSLWYEIRKRGTR